MNVKVAMFAAAKDLVASSAVEVELEGSADVGSLRRELLVRFPQLEPLMKRSQFSVNLEYATDDTVLAVDSDVALIPPVSGG